MPNVKRLIEQVVSGANPDKVWAMSLNESVKPFMVARDPVANKEFWWERGIVWMGSVNHGSLKDFIEKFKRGKYADRIKLVPGVEAMLDKVK